MQLSFASILLLSLAGSSAAVTCNSGQLWSFGIGYQVELPYYSSSDTIDCNMGKGANSNAVKLLQQDLNDCYKRGLKVDGDFGDKTLAALIYAQGKAGTTADGVYGPNTRKKMDWLGDLGGGHTPICRRLSGF